MFCVWCACDLLCGVVWYVYFKVMNALCVFVAVVIVCVSLHVIVRFVLLF